MRVTFEIEVPEYVSHVETLGELAEVLRKAAAAFHGWRLPNITRVCIPPAAYQAARMTSFNSTRGPESWLEMLQQSEFFIPSHMKIEPAGLSPEERQQAVKEARAELRLEELRASAATLAPRLRERE